LISAKRIKENINRVENDILEACLRAGRKREEILLLPVTKNRDPEEIRILYESGCREFGENRVQEMLPKIMILPQDIKWHFIGSLQTNKVRHILDRVVLLHSLDRLSLAEEINRRALINGIKADCLIQINISKEATKGGIYPEDTDRFLDSIGSYDNIRIRGLMTIGPAVYDRDLSRSLFMIMKSKFVDIGCKKMHNVNMIHLSMGMSGDFREAIECGADIVRIGTAIFEEY